LSGYTNPQINVKSSDDASDADTDSKTIFDYTDFGDNDDVYGDYY
jgi:hypothetical protein